LIPILAATLNLPARKEFKTHESKAGYLIIIHKITLGKLLIRIYFSYLQMFLKSNDWNFTRDKVILHEIVRDVTCLVQLVIP